MFNPPLADKYGKCRNKYGVLSGTQIQILGNERNYIMFTLKTQGVLTVLFVCIVGGCESPQISPPIANRQESVQPVMKPQPSVSQPVQEQPSSTVHFQGQDGQPFQIQQPEEDDTPTNTATRGHATLKNDKTGQIIADGDIKTVERWGSVNASKGAIFTCAPTQGQVSFGESKSKTTPIYAALEFSPPDQWKTLDDNFYILSEFVQTGPLTVQDLAGKGEAVQLVFNLERSITRASVLTLPKGEHILFGYRINVQDTSGQITFRLGKVIAHENCQVTSGQ